MKQEFPQESQENDDPSFVDKLKNLLPDIEFKESADMLEARTAILQGMVENPDLLPTAWGEYADICEQTVDNHPSSNSHDRAQLQIAMIIHKALIFREAGNTERYCDELVSAEGYTAGMNFDKLSTALDIELTKLQDKNS